MWYYISRIAVLWFGAGYPAYATYKATKQKNQQLHMTMNEVTEDVNAYDTSNMNKWLTYWIVYAAFICLEPFLDIMAYIVPFYYLMKIAFLYWLVLLQGSLILYHVVIQPILSSKEKDIDDWANRVRTEHLAGFMKVAEDLLKRVVSLMNNATANKSKKPPSVPRTANIPVIVDPDDGIAVLTTNRNNNQPPKQIINAISSTADNGVTTGRKDL